MPETKRVELTYVDYLKLLAGQVVTQDGVEVTIGDFGRERLQQALDFVTAHRPWATDFVDPDVWSYCPICQKDWKLEDGVLHRNATTPQELDIRPCRECETADPLKRETKY